MDLVFVILFVLVGSALFSLWRNHVNLAITLAMLKAQQGRFISDIESEKGTRKRIHTDFDVRIRTLELGYRPQLPHDSQEGSH